MYELQSITIACCKLVVYCTIFSLNGYGFFTVLVFSFLLYQNVNTRTFSNPHNLITKLQMFYKDSINNYLSVYHTLQIDRQEVYDV